MIYLVTNKNLLHVQHATKHSVVTVKTTCCTVDRSIAHLKYISSNTMQDWICSFCIQSVLPFYKV